MLLLGRNFETGTYKTFKKRKI